jgi:hypothetical protein
VILEHVFDGESIAPHSVGCDGVGLLGTWWEHSARRYLNELGERLGTAGLLAAAASPGVLAAIDQHSAAVRDILHFGVPGTAAVAGAVLLAGYARGVLDEAAAQGWTMPSVVDWSTADWTTLRLVAVCALADRPAEEPALEA